MDQRVFWDDSGKCGKGGYFFRTPGLAPFIKKVEESTGKRVIALTLDLDEPNLIEVVVEGDCSPQENEMRTLPYEVEVGPRPMASETKRVRDSGERGLDTREQGAVAGSETDTPTRVDSVQPSGQLTATPTASATPETGR